MSIAAVFAIPGALETPTGGYRYDREVLARLPAHGVVCRHLPLAPSFPFPAAGDLEATARTFEALDAQTVALVDGLALGALPQSVVAKLSGPLVALVHHPLALESGLAAEDAARLRISERQALARAAAIIVTSRRTAETLVQDYAVPKARITVAEPGTERAARATGSGTAALVLLAVGALSPRKNLDGLIAALAPLADRPWRLIVAGATDRHSTAWQTVEDTIRHHGLQGRVTLTGALDDQALARLYGEADLFVMASHYEGYGMVLAEAMARGLPIVTTTGGAAAETVPDAAALKVPPADPAALTAALAQALDDAPLRTRLAEASWQAAQALPSWDDTARRIAAVIKDVAP